MSEGCWRGGGFFKIVKGYGGEAICKSQHFGRSLFTDMTSIDSLVMYLLNEDQQMRPIVPRF